MAAILGRDTGVRHSAGTAAAGGPALARIGAGGAPLAGRAPQLSNAAQLHAPGEVAPLLSLGETGAPDSPIRAFGRGRGMGRSAHVAKRGGCSLGAALCFGRGQQLPAPINSSESDKARAPFFVARNEGSSMLPDHYNCIHRIKYTHRRGKLDKDPQTRAMLSDRFKSMYRQMGLDRPAAAKLLRISERTLHNWETGVHEIPYSAYKLLRLLSYSELPGAWSGWHIAVGRLWSPEGHSFKPDDSSWWSLLCRRAAGFDTLYTENSRLRHAADQAAQPGRKSAAGVTKPVTRKVSLTDETNREIQPNPGAASYVPVTHKVSAKSGTKQPNACPAKVRYNLPKTLFTTTVKGGL